MGGVVTIRIEVEAADALKRNCDMATLDNAGCLSALTNFRAAAASSETDSSPDLFFRLPDEIFNQITSLLTPKALIKTRMLARRWLALSPVVHFSIRSDQEFRKSLESLSEQEVTVKSVSIELENFSNKYGNFTRDLVSLTRKKNFSELSLRWKGSMQQMLHFDSPSLLVLRLDGCVFFRWLQSSWTLSSLQVLSFNNVRFDLEDLSTITFGCPNVSHLSLKQCWDRGRTGVVILSGLKRLKNVQVCGTCYKGIVIDSPDLFFLEYSSTEKASKIDVRHCKKLEVLKLKTKINPKLLLGKLFPGFPLLGYVNSHCSSSVSHHARSFNICADLSVKATPDMCVFKYVRSGFGEYVRSFKFSSIRNHKPKPQWKLARFKEDSVIISTCFFMDFRRLVEICEGTSIFSFRLLLRKGVDLGELRYSCVSPVRHIGHLKLKLAGAFIKIPSPYSKILLDAFLFCCYPDTLTLKLRKNQNVFIEDLREKLKQRGERWKMCCKTSNVKCWRHFLEDVEFEHTARTNKQGTEYERLDIRFQWAY